MTIKLFDLLVKQGIHHCNTYDQNEIIRPYHKTNRKRLYLVRSGAIKLSYPNESGELLISIILAENQFFGSCQIIAEDTLNYTYQALQAKTIVYEFEIHQIQSMLQKKIILPTEVFCLIGIECCLLERRIRILQNRFVENRVKETLLDFQKNFEISSADEYRIALYCPLNQEEFANYIRASRVITNKMFNDLKRSLQIECLKNRIILNKSFYSS
ncbi:Crp/Fnr family transcriptional regulator [Aquimarina spongiae]|uniref:CRP/FNR family transcriptional regulator, anaerobic regulatory protein n=1 Tax=Aquimarina spongiae TaxID=570521 RepID=A0A1M6AS15_9FLAO|nr:Crp/Fnr family transcriptional regulator [Aquimarina spongiae]SHI39128.1 CRP/FNR family transcriptional regulator, anaerobic regulatory protein [Aquimarina spongiae]